VPEKIKQDEKFAPKRNTGISFDEMIARAVRVTPPKEKKASRPKKK
jgi:hypothetical protein